MNEINDCKDKSKAIVYNIPCYTLKLEFLNLDRFRNFDKDKPIMLLYKNKGLLHCKCSVPEVNHLDFNLNYLFSLPLQIIYPKKIVLIYL